MSQRGHEPHHIDAPTLHKLAGIFVVALVLILWAMYLLWRHVHPLTLSMPPQRVPPLPRLQVAAPIDRVEQYRLQDQRLESYGWIDAKQSVAHIPIERAMALLAADHHANVASSDKRGTPP